MAINVVRKRAKEENGVELSFEDTRNVVRGMERLPHVPSVQQTLTGTNASARSAKHPAEELYDRLGLAHCLPREMRSKFLEASVFSLQERKRRTLVRVGTPLLEVAYPAPIITHHPNTHSKPCLQEVLSCLTPDWRTALRLISDNVQLHQRIGCVTFPHQGHSLTVSHTTHSHRVRSGNDIRCKTLLNAVLQSPLVKATVVAHNRIEGSSMRACNLRTRTASQIALGIPFKAMKTLGLHGFNRHKFLGARSHAKAYGPGQDPFDHVRRRFA